MFRTAREWNRWYSQERERTEETTPFEIMVVVTEKRMAGSDRKQVSLMQVTRNESETQPVITSPPVQNDLTNAPTMNV